MDGHLGSLNASRDAPPHARYGNVNENENENENENAAPARTTTSIDENVTLTKIAT